MARTRLLVVDSYHQTASGVTRALGEALVDVAEVESWPLGLETMVLAQEQGADVLLGGELRRRLGDVRPWSLRSLGPQLLRGKGETVEVFALGTGPEQRAKRVDRRVCDLAEVLPEEVAEIAILVRQHRRRRNPGLP